MQEARDSFTFSIREVLNSTANSDEELQETERIWQESEEIAELLRVATETSEPQTQYYTRT